MLSPGHAFSADGHALKRRQPAWEPPTWSARSQSVHKWQQCDTHQLSSETARSHSDPLRDQKCAHDQCTVVRDHSCRPMQRLTGYSQSHDMLGSVLPDLHAPTAHPTRINIHMHKRRTVQHWCGVAGSVAGCNMGARLLAARATEDPHHARAQAVGPRLKVATQATRLLVRIVGSGAERPHTFVLWSAGTPILSWHPRDT